MIIDRIIFYTELLRRILFGWFDFRNSNNKRILKFIKNEVLKIESTIYWSYRK